MQLEDAVRMYVETARPLLGEIDTDDYPWLEDMTDADLEARNEQALTSIEEEFRVSIAIGKILALRGG